MINVLLVEDKKMSRECLEGYIAASGRYTLAASISNAGMAEMTWHEVSRGYHPHGRVHRKQ